MKSLQWLLSALSPLVLATTILGQSVAPPAGMIGSSVAFGLGGGVKGAPYFADVVHEFTQALADGNRIHRESQGKIFRDAEGRSRSETEDDGFGRTAPPRIMIHDPVSQTYLTLYPQTKTAIVNHMTVLRDGTGRALGVGSGTGSGVVTDATGRGIGVGSSAGSGVATRGKTPEELLADLKALKEAQGNVQITQRSMQTSSEQLGKKEIEGFIASGNRHSRTIPAGEIGNEKPIVSTTETWFCEDLKTTLLSVADDPQSGQRIMRLTNIRAGDPDPQLFQIPPDYTVKDMSQREEIVVKPSTPK